MRIPRVSYTVRQLMLGVMAVGVLFCLPGWLTSLGERVLWTEGGEVGGEAGMLSPVRVLLIRPVLSAWVVPTLTLAVIWPNPTRWGRLFGLAAVGLVLASWLMLGRPWIIGPGSIRYWPDGCLWYIEERLTNGRFAGGLMWDFFWPSNARQVADLVALVAFLALTAVSFYRPVPRRIAALVTLAANGSTFAAWSALMWSDRHWGIGEPPLWPGHLGATMPRPSGAEIVQGTVLLGLICYLLSIIVPIHLPRFGHRRFA